MFFDAVVLSVNKPSPHTSVTRTKLTTIEFITLTETCTSEFLHKVITLQTTLTKVWLRSYL